MATLITRANTIFCVTTPNVNLAILFIIDIFLISSSMITISAASIAASEPIAPMAKPTSDLAITGVSLIPSPTKASFSFLCS